MNKSGADERRKYKRFRIKEESSFFMTEENPLMGKLLDISEGGFSFNYLGEKQWPDKADEVGMLFGGHESCLNDLPVNTVSDHLVESGISEHSIIVRRRCVKFGELSKKQKFLLECFIWINTEAEC